MIVCLCNAVSDRTIRQSVREGARTVSEVRRSCRAGRGCGQCRFQVAEIIAESSSACAPPLASLHARADHEGASTDHRPPE